MITIETIVNIQNDGLESHIIAAYDFRLKKWNETYSVQHQNILK